MCFHNSLSIDAQKIENRFDAKFQDKSLFKMVYHGSGFSFMFWPVITSASPDTFTYLNWGLIPHWVKNRQEAADLRPLTLNARAETVFSKPAFSYSIKTKRCLIPSTGFFEWQHNNGLKKPYFIYPTTEELMAMGGLYSRWTDLETGEVHDTFSIVTTPANTLMAEIHNTKRRMPLILKKEDERSWLGTSHSEIALNELMHPIYDGYLKAHTVGRLVSGTLGPTNVPEVQKPFIYPEMPALF